MVDQVRGSLKVVIPFFYQEVVCLSNHGAWGKCILSLSLSHTHTIISSSFFLFKNHIVDEFILLPQQISVVISFFFSSLSIV
uniref:Putative ovule protein n=1 Tax=Solanum chacoense TaxID=4108 RepID=A0A0V0HFL1_SOLCH